MEAGIFTNGVYDILGISINKKIIGVIIKTLNPHIYKKYTFVIWPKYATPSSKPNFIKKK